MKRSVTLPYPRAAVYHALMDPILLVGWLDIPYASTGYGPLHLFELEDWTESAPWKIRGFILDNVRDEGFKVEKDQVGEEMKPTLDFRLTDGEGGCVLELESDNAYFDRTIKMFMDSRGHLRLGQILRVEAPKLAKAE